MKYFETRENFGTYEDGKNLHKVWEKFSCFLLLCKEEDPQLDKTNRMMGRLNICFNIYELVQK